ncbi:hypothetical protein [Pelagibius sp.]|uniref:hypothetical protein n=1 Tax=Pelagibius sp. TaxID=1931238 RepID=UPI003B50FB13
MSVSMAGPSARLCSRREPTVPSMSASQEAGMRSPFRVAMAPQTAQPYSVKVSGQQRTAKPSSWRSSAMSRRAL